MRPDLANMLLNHSSNWQNAGYQVFRGRHRSVKAATLPTLIALPEGAHALSDLNDMLNHFVVPDKLPDLV